MKVLFIGGTGNISTACTRLALQKGYDVYHLNRGNSENPFSESVKLIKSDINEHQKLKSILKGQHFDIVANFIAYIPEDIKRDYEIFSDKTDQYIFISSASAYQKPPAHAVITESTPLKRFSQKPSAYFFCFSRIIAPAAQ